MGLYDKKPELTKKTLPLEIDKFPIYLVVMVIYISSVTILNTGSYFIYVLRFFGLGFAAASMVDNLTCLGLSIVLVSFCFGFIRKIWPPVIVSIFALINLVKFMSPEVKIADLTHFQYNESLDWFGTITGTPYWLMDLIGFNMLDLSIGSQRFIHISGLLLTLAVCGVLINFWLTNEKAKKNLTL